MSKWVKKQRSKIDGFKMKAAETICHPDLPEGLGKIGRES